MKKMILLMVMVLGIATLYAQGTATYRLEGSETPPNIGDEFLVELWLDELSCDGELALISSSFVGIEYNPDAVSVIHGPVPYFLLYWNLCEMINDSCGIYGNVPYPGDLRYLYNHVYSPGINPESYGGTPMRLWDIKFVYNGGDAAIVFNNALTNITGSCPYSLNFIENTSFGTTGTVENNFNNITIWPIENNICINVPGTTNGYIIVVNMMGQEVLRTDIKHGMNILPVNDLNIYYIVKVVGNDAITTRKVYIK